MDTLIWLGALVSLFGVALLFYCIRRAVGLRNDSIDDAEMKTALQRLSAVNMGALAISAIGLMMVVVGVLLR